MNSFGSALGNPVLFRRPFHGLLRILRGTYTLAAVLSGKPFLVIGSVLLPSGDNKTKGNQP